MRCPECAAETAEASLFCTRCGAPAGMQSPTAEDMVAGRYGHGAATAPAVAASEGAPFGRTRDVSLRVGAGIVAGAAAATIIWACALPLVITGGTAFSIFSGSRLIWPAVEPVGVAVLGVCAGIVMMTGRRGSGLRWLAAGVLLASGTQIVLFFVGLRFGVGGGGRAARARPASSAEYCWSWPASWARSATPRGGVRRLLPRAGGCPMRGPGQGCG